MEIALTNPLSSNSQHVPHWPTMHFMCQATAFIAAVNHWLSSENDPLPFKMWEGIVCLSVYVAIPSGLGVRCPSCAGSSQHPGLVWLACSHPSLCRNLFPQFGQTARRRTPCTMGVCVSVCLLKTLACMHMLCLAHTYAHTRTHTHNRLGGFLVKISVN